MDIKSFQREHGISEEVWNARPYIRFEQGDFETVERDFANYVEHRFGAQLTTKERQIVSREKKHLRKIVQQSGGLIMVRDGGWVGMDHRGTLHDRVMSAELRPDKPVIVDGQRRWHYHPTELPRFVEEWIEAMNAGKRNDPSLLWPVADDGTPLFRADQVALADDVQNHIAKDDKRMVNAHNGVNDEGVHWHVDKAKYVFLPGDGHASRIDVHPLAHLRMEDGMRRVYFVIEGCIKSDAVLSSILATDEAASVVSVPSVTAWDSEDLVWLFRILCFYQPELVVVPDADWSENPAVLMQALLLRSILRRNGFRAQVAAPPRAGLPDIKGVDDFLGSGGKLAELEVLDREAPPPVDLLLLSDRRADFRENCARMLQALAEHADENGEIRCSLRKAGRLAGVSKNTAQRTLSALVAGRMITTYDSIELKDHVLVGGLQVREFEFVTVPTFVLPPHLRAEPFNFRPLGEPGAQMTAEQEDRFVARISAAVVEGIEQKLAVREAERITAEAAEYED